jgi:dihydroflavonol-4-reductase
MCKFAFMILVTGGTGLVGAHLLLKLLETDQNIRALYRSNETLITTKNLFAHYSKEPLFNTIDWVKGDIVDVPSLEVAFIGVTHVYHCAAFISFDPKDEEMLRKVNIEGTANMVNCSLAFGVHKFCHVSSIAALGDTVNDGDTITEETEWNPERSHNDYAISKYGAEMEVWRGWQEGLNAVIVNPGVIFGYGYWHQGSGAILKAVNSGQYFYTLGKCGFIAVEDLVNIMTMLMQSTITGERFILVTENLTYKEMLNAVADGLKKSKPSIRATRLLTSIGWRMDWLVSKLSGRKRLLTKSMAQSSHATDVYNTSKIDNALGFQFTSLKPYLNELCARFLSSRR